MVTHTDSLAQHIDDAESVRSVTYVIAASDAPAHVKAQADYICYGTADDVKIQAAINAISNTIGGTILLSEGTFYIASPVIQKSFVSIVGATPQGRATSTQRSGTILQASANLAAFISTSDAVHYNMTVKNIMLYSPDAYTATVGILWYGAVTSLIEDIATVHQIQEGIEILTTTGAVEPSEVHIIRNHIAAANITGTHRAIWLQGGDHRLERNIVGNRDRGIQIDGSANVFVGDHVANTGAIGILLSGTAKAANRFIGLEIENNTGVGMNLNGSLNVIIGTRFLKNNLYAIRFMGGNNNTITDCVFDENSFGSTNTYSDIYFEAAATGNLITSNIHLGNSVTKYAIDENSVGNSNLIYSNVFSGQATAAINAVGQGAATKIANNSGWITENSGTGTIANGATSAVITHGLSYTPARADIIVTLGENPTSTPGAIWIDTIGATQFTVNCENDPGASGLDFSWAVRKV